MTPRPTPRQIMAALSEEQGSARYYLKEYAAGRTSVFDRSISDFLPLGAIRDIDVTEQYEEGGE